MAGPAIEGGGGKFLARGGRIEAENLEVRISNFRSLRNVSVYLNDFTLLIGANNSGKTSFLDAFHAAIGSSTRSVGNVDIYVDVGEAEAPKDRVSVIDALIRPTANDGSEISNFPAGSFWTGLWGTGISQDGDFNDFVGI